MRMSLSHRLLIVIVCSFLGACDFLFEQTRKPMECISPQVSSVMCDTCAGMVANGEIKVITTAEIMDSIHSSTKDTTLLMFVSSGCPGLPTTMPSFLELLEKRSDMKAMLIFSDNYADAAVARARATGWGWKDRMFILDQEECGCYMDTRQRNAVVLEKLGIQAPDKYHLTVNLLIKMDRKGSLLDTTQYLKL